MALNSKIRAGRFRTTVLLLLFIASGLIPCSRLSAQQDDDVIRVSTELVILNITVTNNAGQYVPGLRLSDFKITEDGREVALSDIASFSSHESPFASVILLDTSGSMEIRLSLARSAAIRFLDQLRPEDVAAVYKFDSKVEQVQEFSGGRDLAPMAFGLRARGLTSLHDAILKASTVLAERPEKRKAIIVLSDGMDTQSKASADKALESALSIGASIYAVDMSALEGRSAAANRQSAMMLKNFADKSGGRFVETPGGPALREAFANIAEELGHQYTVAFRPVNRTRDGKWRKLDVKIAREDLIVRTRKAYKAPKG